MTIDYHVFEATLAMLSVPKTHWLICVLLEDESRRSILELYVEFLGLQESTIANPVQITIYDVCAPDQLPSNLVGNVAEML